MKTQEGEISMAKGNWKSNNTAKREGKHSIMKAMMAAPRRNSTHRVCNPNLCHCRSCRRLISPAGSGIEKERKIVSD